MPRITQEISYNCDYGDNTFNLAIDIGGTLAKVVFSPIHSNRLMFYTIETEKIDKFMELLHSIIKEHNNGCYRMTHIIATGGGAFKFYDLLYENFPQIKGISRFEEMEGLIHGLDFFIHEIPDEVFTYNDQEGERIIPTSSGTMDSKAIYPYLLVNIGSGVSILKVTEPNNFSRVGGSSLGGGTLWGLLSLITGAQTYDQMLDWAQEGDNSSVDMLVGDIYGTDYNKIGLKSSAIASSFGKVFQNRITSNKSLENNENKLYSSHESIEKNNGQMFKNPDICKSLLFAISNNIGQIAYLQAKINNIQNIYFGGSYTRGHLTTMNTLSYAINFWSQGSKQAFFLKHEGYLGAMGAFLSASRHSSTKKTNT
ncbi:BAQ_1a_G0013730.mRNA.1.CDS.1 [Saccharomyces cerevisiae]|nr:BAQ_1a_G0013730.mRNA.1.CDS.1 [Saccharomyces cerevisiae]CAI4551653.1 BAM_G0022710.mRNA.1.CDS.1 [Saccharomyces cerevisiae]CAI7087350.1 BAQ_1a_G0013730.mRNA.1.CDS.1 [Saccharomyces cerevisiae]CAI7159208.1 BAM_G0022710.mRNA.1.CDS.1 [Saccharomyces cerevisiae]